MKVYLLGAGRLLPVGGGAAILLGGHFQNLDCFWGVIFRHKGSVTWGVIKQPQ